MHAMRCSVILSLVLCFLAIHECKGENPELAKDDSRRFKIRSPVATSSDFPWLLSYRQGTAPEILNILTNRTLSTGKGVAFRCRAVGNPKPRIKWKKDGVTITQSIRVKIRQFEWGSRLRIKNIQASDEGVYKCVAKNNRGYKVSPPAYVKVKGNRKHKPGRCEVYTGRFCNRGFVYIPHGKLQYQLDRRVGKLVNMVRSSRCKKQLIMFLCRVKYPSCSLRSNDKPLMVCREDCRKLEMKSCRRNMRILGPLWHQTIVCSKLPQTNCQRVFGHGIRSPEHVRNKTAVNTLPPRACKRYHGNICKAYLTTGGLVSTHGQQTQSVVERGLGRVLLMLRNYTSSKCRLYLEKALCYHLFSPCSTGPHPTSRQICRLQCEVLQGRICSKEFRLARSLNPDSNILPWCSTLPPSVENNVESCLNLGINVNDNGERSGWDKCAAFLKRNEKKKIQSTVMSQWRRTYSLCKIGTFQPASHRSKIPRNVIKLLPGRNLSNAQISVMKKEHKITYCFEMQMRLKRLVLRWDHYHHSLPLPHLKDPPSGVEVPGLQVTLNQISSKIDTILVLLGSAASYRVHEKILLENVTFYYRYQSSKGSFIAEGQYRLCESVFDVLMEAPENGVVTINGNSSSPLDVNTIERVFGLAIPTNLMQDAIRRSQLLVMRIMNPSMQIYIDREINVKFAGQSFWTSDGHSTFLEFFGGKRHQTDVLVASLTTESLTFDKVFRTFTGIELLSLDWMRGTSSESRVGVLLSTIDLDLTHDTIFRIKGEPLSTVLAGSIPAGLTIMSQTRVPRNCNGSKMCEIVKMVFGQESLFTMKTTSKDDQVTFDVTFEKVSHNALVDYKSIKVSLKVVNGNMSLLDVLPSLAFNADGYVDVAHLQDKKLHFTGLLEYNGIWASLTGRFDVSQIWQQAFGIEHLTLKNIRASFTAPTDGITSNRDHSISTRADFQFGVGCSPAASLIKKDGCITGKVFLGLSEDIREHYFYGSVESVTLLQLLKAYDIDVQLPAAIASIGFPSGLKMSVARTMHDMGLSGGPLISPGFVMTGTLNMFGIDNDASVTLLPREFVIDAGIDSLGMEFLDDVTPLDNLQNNKPYRPRVYLKTRLDPEPFIKVHIDGYSRIFGVFDELRILVSREAMQIKLVAEIHQSIQAHVLLVSNYSKQVNKTHLTAKIIFKNQLSKLTRLASKHVVKMLEAEMSQLKVVEKEVKRRSKECSLVAKNVCARCSGHSNCLAVLSKCNKQRSKGSKQTMDDPSFCQSMVFFDSCTKSNYTKTCDNICALLGTHENDSCLAYRKAAKTLKRLEKSLQWVRQARFLISGNLFNIHSISFEAETSLDDLVNTVVDATFDVTIFGQRNTLTGLQLHFESFSKLASEIAKQAVTWYDKRNRLHSN